MIRVFVVHEPIGYPAKARRALRREAGRTNFCADNVEQATAELIQAERARRKHSKLWQFVSATFYDREEFARDLDKATPVLTLTELPKCTLQQRAKALGRAASIAGIAAPASDQGMFDLMREANPSGMVGNPVTLEILKAWHAGRDLENISDKPENNR